jgi:hypothetical protein
MQPLDDRPDGKKVEVVRAGVKPLGGGQGRQ